MLSKTRSPKPAVKQQALGTAPAEGSRQGLFRGSTIRSAAYLLYKMGRSTKGAGVASGVLLSFCSLCSVVRPDGGPAPE